MFVYVCGLHVLVCVVHVCACMCSSEINIGSLLKCSHLVEPGVDPYSQPCVAMLVVLVTDLLWGIPCLCSPSAGIAIGHHTIIYVGPGDLNSGPHACVTRTLTPKPFPQPSSQYVLGQLVVT